MNIRRVGLIGLGVVVVAVGAGYAVLASVDVDSYRGVIIKAAEDATGRKVTIDKPLKLKISLSPAVVVEGVTMSNAPWAKQPIMIKVGHAEAEVGLLPLLSGAIAVNRLVVTDTAIDLVRRKDGSANWEFTPAGAGPATKEAEPAKAEKGEMPKIAVRDVSIKNLALSFDDQAGGQKIALDVKSLTATAASASDPVKLALDIAYNGLPIAAKGAVGPIEALLQDKPATVDLAVEVPGVKVSAKGKIAQPMSAQGIDLKVGFEGKAYDQVGKAVGADLAAVPPLAFDGVVQSAGKTGYGVKDGVLKLGGQEIRLAAGADLSGAKPQVKADVSADSLDLPKLLDAISPKSESAKPAAAKPAAKGDGRVFPADPLPLDGLKAANANVTIKVASLIVPSGVKLSNVAVGAVLKDGLLTVNPAFGVGGGTIDGKTTLDARGKAANLDVALNSKGVSLGTVASDMGKSKMITGSPTDMTIGVKGSGRSVRDLMAGLDGNVKVEIGKGEIVNAELRKEIGDWAASGITMVDPTFATRQKTVVDCVVVRVPVKQGLAALGRGVAAETDVMNLTVTGDVNLKTEALNLGLNPVTHGVGTGLAQSAGGMVKVGGTFGAPAVGLDAMATGKTALKIGAAVATGGLSLVGDALIDQATKDPHPCLTAKGESSSTSGSSGSGSGSTTKTQSDGSSGGIGGAVKGLFGK